MIHVQIIEKNGKPEWAVLPYGDYEQLREAAEMAEDIRAYHDAIAHPQPLIPGDVVHRILDGESPIKVWRETHGLSQRQLAEAAGISSPYLHQLESKKRTGTAKVLSAIASALQLSVDELIL